jgi:lysine 2,3-aminomutase
MDGIADISALIQAGLADPADAAALEQVTADLPVGISPAMRALIGAPGDPVGLQFIPSLAEADAAPYESADPIGDAALSPLKGIVHRYPDRALLKPLLVCPVYCRFCFRREQVGPDGGLLAAAELRAAYAWLAARPAIREVILTGGDPLMLSPRRLREILGALSALPQIEVLRIHSRVPVVAPGLVTEALLEALSGTAQPLYLVIHANSAREFTPEAAEALGRLRRAGVILLSQSVLLRGVNDTPEAMEALLRGFVRLGVKPYYLHQLDPAPGTSRFRVPIEEGRALLRGLRGRISGLAWPVYVLDSAGLGKQVL